MIDYESLIDLLNMGSMDELRKSYRGYIEESLEKWGRERQPRWTESIAVGSEDFVRDMKEKLWPRAIWREIVGANGIYELREPMNEFLWG